MVQNTNKIIMNWGPRWLMSPELCSICVVYEYFNSTDASKCSTRYQNDIKYRWFIMLVCLTHLLQRSYGKLSWPWWLVMMNSRTRIGMEMMRIFNKIYTLYKIFMINVSKLSLCSLILTNEPCGTNLASSSILK